MVGPRSGVAVILATQILTKSQPLCHSPSLLFPPLPLHYVNGRCLPLLDELAYVDGDL